MTSYQSKGVQFVGSFLVSVALAYWIYRRNENWEQIESQIYGNIGTASGLFVGSKLAERADE